MQTIGLVDGLDVDGNINNNPNSNLNSNLNLNKLNIIMMII